MQKSLRLALRMITLILCIVCAISFVYIYSVQKINGYYAPKSGDRFLSSMAIDRIIPCANGNVLTVGTFLQGDDIMQNHSIFVKAYTSEGDVIAVSSIDIKAGFSIQTVRASADGAIIMVTDDESESDTAEIYKISSQGKLLRKIEAVCFVPDTYDVIDTAEFFVTEEENGGIIYATVANRSIVTFFDEESNRLFETNYSIDARVSGIAKSGDRSWIFGSLLDDNRSSAYVVGCDEFGEQKFAVRVMTDSVSVCDDVFVANDKIYACGIYFDEAAFVEENKNIDSKVAEKKSDIAVDSMKNRNGTVLISNDYLNVPWAQLFIIEIDGDGNVVETGSPFKATMNFGGTDFEKLGTGHEIMAFTMRLAPSLSSSQYVASYFKVLDDFSTTESAEIVLPANVSAHFATAPDGHLICYTGITNETGAVEYCLKNFADTKEFAEMQRRLVVYDKVIEKIRQLTEPKTLVLIFIFLLLYFTARFTLLEIPEKKAAGKKAVAK